MYIHRPYMLRSGLLHDCTWIRSSSLATKVRSKGSDSYRAHPAFLHHDTTHCHRTPHSFGVEFNRLNSAVVQLARKWHLHPNNLDGACTVCTVANRRFTISSEFPMPVVCAMGAVVGHFYGNKKISRLHKTECARLL